MSDPFLAIVNGGSAQPPAPRPAPRAPARPSGGPAPSFDAIQRVFPDVTMNSGVRTPEHNREVGGVSNSTHLGLRPGVQGYDINVQPGMTVDEAAARIEAANPGVRVVEKRDETGRTGPNGKPLSGWHFALLNNGDTDHSAASTAQAPTAINDPFVSIVNGGNVPADASGQHPDGRDSGGGRIPSSVDGGGLPDAQRGPPAQTAPPPKDTWAGRGVDLVKGGWEGVNQAVVGAYGLAGLISPEEQDQLRARLKSDNNYQNDDGWSRSIGNFAG